MKVIGYKLLLIPLIINLMFASVSAAELEDKIEANKPLISIVVDDLGDNSIIARQLAQLPVPLTMAILPKTPHAYTIANLANENGHEVIMHQPMEAFSRPDLLGPGAIFSDMEEQEVLDTIIENAETIPHLVGLNNHMGSLLTQDIKKMNQVMQTVKARNWYFLDSKTNKESQAESIASKWGVPAVGRDIFLDHHTQSEKIELEKILLRRLEQAKNIAHQYGKVVVICHPYPETFSFLAKKLPELKSNFNFVKISELIDNKKVSFKNIAKITKEKVNNSPTIQQNSTSILSQ
ncbi:divergent polysaccharide deacetylase family protein [Aliikangiella sp. G2MR2-5]|uniref:divergent polysaccharide deacetylase family protein n=1 Tax=Aliikangiella sp. G2MR2-5 TaxID=2788943 RepID=UPI0018A926A8|nr:divergent polysaccharide deacetylase family protein [Aliikangiella sp. G2MR2-5]